MSEENTWRKKPFGGAPPQRRRDRGGDETRAPQEGELDWESLRDRRSKGWNPARNQSRNNNRNNRNNNNRNRQQFPDRDRRDRREEPPRRKPEEEKKPAVTAEELNPKMDFPALSDIKTTEEQEKKPEEPKKDQKPTWSAIIQNKEKAKKEAKPIPKSDPSKPQQVVNWVREKDTRPIGPIISHSPFLRKMAETHRREKLRQEPPEIPLAWEDEETIRIREEIEKESDYWDRKYADEYEYDDEDSC